MQPTTLPRNLAHEAAPARCVGCAREFVLRSLMPPLTILLLMITAGALLLAAAVCVVTPLPTTPLFTPPVAVTETPPTNATDTALAEVAALSLTQTPSVVDLARLIYAPGDGGSAADIPGPCMLVVESGALAARVEGAVRRVAADRDQAVITGDIVLAPGDGLYLPLGARVAFHNRSSQTAVALVAGIIPYGGGANRFGRVGLASWSPSWTPGATVQPLAGGGIAAQEAQSATLTLRRMVLPEGTQVSFTAPGPVDLAVESGVLTLVTRDGLVRLQRPAGQDRAIEPQREATLLPNDAALLQTAAKVTLKNAGRAPLVFLILAVEPAGDDRSGPHLTPPIASTTVMEQTVRPGVPTATSISALRQTLHVSDLEQPSQDETDLRAYLTTWRKVATVAAPLAPCHSDVSC